MQVFTDNLSADTTIVRGDGIFRMSVKASGGSIGIIGNWTFRERPSVEVAMAEGDSFFMAAEPGQPIDNVTIKPNGNVAIFYAFSG